MQLDDLGPRICILGPSNSGKSTMAQAMAQARDYVPVHLDQLHHLPNTAWIPRPRQDFMALHCTAIAKERWVMDGNYLGCLAQRLARTTGVIVLDVPTIVSVLRYLRRSWCEPYRYGALEGGKNQVTWAMLRHIAIVERRKQTELSRSIEAVALPTTALRTTSAIDRFYRVERLQRPDWRD
ncbi:AAA family ATPase [Xanthomonas phaseoli]